MEAERQDFAVDGESELGPEAAVFDDAGVEAGTAGVDCAEELVDGGGGDLKLRRPPQRLRRVAGMVTRAISRRGR